MKNKNKGVTAVGKFFGLEPVPPIANPFSGSRGPTTEILWLGGVPNPVNCSTTSIASVFGITAASVQSFADYAANWEEYVIRAVEWEYISTGSQIGMVKAYIDEADNSTPTATTAGKHQGFVAPCQASTGFRKKLRWTAKDTNDLAWVATSNTSKFITCMKIYSNQANYGLTGTTEMVGFLNINVCVQFRTQGGA